MGVGRDRVELARERRALFGGAVDAYERGRPGYPAAVFDVLAQVCGLGPGCRVLEIGPGPGQATGPLLASGAQVTAVELSAALAERLRGNHPGAALTVEVGAFEAAVVPPASFDLVTSAASFHWVDPAVGPAKVATVLRPGGWAALWWSIYTDAGRHDPLAAPLRTVLRRRAPHLLDDPVAGAHPGQAGAHHSLRVDERLEELARVGAFEPAQLHLFRWAAWQTAAEACALLGTFSPMLALPEVTRTAILDDVAEVIDDQPGGRVQRPFQTALYVARRR